MFARTLLLPSGYQGLSPTRDDGRAEVASREVIILRQCRRRPVPNRDGAGTTMDARRPARDRVQAICSAAGTRCRTRPVAFVMARIRRYSIEIRNSNGGAVFVTLADWDEEGRRAAAALILRIDGRLESGNAVDLGRGFRQSQGSGSPSSLRRRRRTCSPVQRQARPEDPETAEVENGSSGKKAPSVGLPSPASMHCG
jgi:hypothetical protein